MSYRRFEQDDIVVSADSITSPAWSNNAGYAHKIEW